MVRSAVGEKRWEKGEKKRRLVILWKKESERGEKIERRRKEKRRGGERRKPRGERGETGRNFRKIVRSRGWAEEERGG